jgi:hypothetical protein
MADVFLARAKREGAAMVHRGNTQDYADQARDFHATADAYYRQRAAEERAERRRLGLRS